MHQGIQGGNIPHHTTQVIRFGLRHPNESAGLGDRFKGLAVAVWLVPHFDPSVSPSFAWRKYGAVSC